MGEFERQLATLLDRGYPEAAGTTAATFRKHLEPLGDRVLDLAAKRQGEDGGFPFVVVVKGDLVAADRAIGLVERRGERGFSVLEADDLAGFGPIEEVTLPGGSAYLLVDVHTGRDTLNVTPDDALEAIHRGGRSPLTIEEGIALVTHHPEAVARNGGFSLAGSRCGDRRVTALWISKNRPKLGWCWAGNPHTWLGTASCAGRIGG
jgi:Family of unknown function (DUF5701)